MERLEEWATSAFVTANCHTWCLGRYIHHPYQLEDSRSSPGATAVVSMKSLQRCAVVACSFAVARAFRTNPTPRSGGSILDQSSSASVDRNSRSSDRSSVRFLPLSPCPTRLRNSPSFAHLRKTRIPRWLSSRTVDVDVIDVIDVTEEERRKERDDMRATTGASRGRGRSRTDIAEDVGNLLDEAVHIFRDAGPQAVGARGIRASRYVEPDSLCACCRVGTIVGEARTARKISNVWQVAAWLEP